MSGKLNIDGRVSIPVVINGDIPDGVDSIIRQDYDDRDYVFVDDCDGIGEHIEPYILGHPCVEEIRPNLKLLNTIGPSEYTPNGWQLPYVLGLSESTGEYVLLCNPTESIQLNTVSVLIDAIGDAPMATFGRDDYNDQLKSAIMNDAEFTWLEGPVLLRKDVYFRRASQIIGQFHYMRFLQLRMWVEGDIVVVHTDHPYLPVEDVDIDVIMDNLLQCGYITEDISPGGKYNYELNNYELRDLSIDLRQRAGVDGVDILEFTREINYATS